MLGRILGRVLGAEGRPIADAVVTVESGPSHPDIAAVTGSDGRFALGGLRSGRYRLRAEIAGLEPGRGDLHLPPGGRAELELRLRASHDWPEAEEIPGEGCPGAG